MTYDNWKLATPPEYETDMPDEDPMTTPTPPDLGELRKLARERAIEIARACAKAKPQSYYSEPFEPHEWVIDAIVTACDRAERYGSERFAEAVLIQNDLIAALARIESAERERDEWKARAESTQRDLSILRSHCVTGTQHEDGIDQVEAETAEAIADFVGECIDNDAPGDWPLIPRRIRAGHWKTTKGES